MKKQLIKIGGSLILVLMVLITSTAFGQRGGHFGGGFSHFSSGVRFNSGFSTARTNFNMGMTHSNMHVNNMLRPMPLGAVRRLPSYYARIYFGGYPYYFNDGLFYAWYGNYYGLIAPPFGLTIGILPRGYWGFSWGGFPYYYHSGIYYRQTNDNQYEVVKAPVGAIVPNIPKVAKLVVIKGEKLYEYLGTYYKEIVDEKGTIQYRIEGKDGVLNTDENTMNGSIPEVVISNPNKGQVMKTYSIGEIVLQLPDHCTTVIINDKKLYVSLEHVYFEEYIENNTLKYKVVGK